MAIGCEQYFNLYSTTVAVGGYTSGSGVLNVAATSGVTLNSGDTCRLLVYRIVGGVATSIVLLKATAVNSSTQFAVTAEGSDANALATDIVINVNSVGGQNKIRADQSVLDTYANQPSTSSAHSGDQHSPTNALSNYDYIFNGSIWVPKFRPDQNLTLPPAASNWGWLSQGGATLTDLPGGGLVIVSRSADTNFAGITQTAPSTPYTITVGFSMLAMAGPTIGMFFYNSGDNKGVLFHLSSGLTSNTVTGANLSTSKWTALNTTWAFSASYANNSGNPYAFWGYGGLVYFRITDDGTNLKFYYGIDPSSNFVQFDSRARHDFMAAGPTSYGIHLGTSLASYPSMVKVMHLVQT